MLVGHSFGAMMACEVAALRPARVRRLALIDPIGLWLDDAPVINWMLLAPAGDARARLQRSRRRGGEGDVHDPRGSRGGGARASRPTWAMGSTGKFIWPIPDKGLKKRIHRVGAPRC